MGPDPLLLAFVLDLHVKVLLELLGLLGQLDRAPGVAVFLGNGGFGDLL